MQHVFENFLDPLLVVFGPPNTEDQPGFLAEYARQLKGYSVDQLKIAKDAVLRTHKGPSRWPKIADCVGACERAADTHAAQAAARRPPPSDWRMKANTAERMMRESVMGQRAAAEGWANGCREFVMEHNRLPTEHEIRRLVGNARFIDRCASGEENMGYMHESLQGLASKLVERREAIATRVMGDDQ